MKKPNITEGEWSLFVPPMINTNMVLVDDIIVADSLTLEDARAISAVPEMIDALVNAHGTLESLTYSGADKFVVEEELKNVEQALKKAGCV